MTDVYIVQGRGIEAVVTIRSSSPRFSQPSPESRLIHPHSVPSYSDTTGVGAYPKPQEYSNPHYKPSLTDKFPEISPFLKFLLAGLGH